MNQYAEEDLLKVNGVQELHVCISFFKLVLNIQSVGAGVHITLSEFKDFL